jgi:hypothetical protein
LWIVIWLAVALASLIVFLIAILSVPLEIQSLIEVDEKPKLKVRLKWLFGLLKKDIGKKKKSAEKKTKQKVGGGRKWFWAAFRVIRTKGMLNQLRHLAKRIIHSFKIKELRVNFKVGLDDPADTSFILGIINLVRLFWKPSFHHEINIQPDYEGLVFLEGYADLTVRVIPIRIAVSLARFLFSWSSMNVMCTLVVTKWKK